MPMAAQDIIRLIKEGIPGAEVEIEDMAATVTITPPRLFPRPSPANPRSSSTRWSMAPWAAAWGACCMPSN